MTCTRCDGSGFLNLHQIEDDTADHGIEAVLVWMKDPTNQPHDVQVCDCCGNGEDWHGTPGQHYATGEDQPGPSGAYAYNGGLCECH